MRRILLLGGGGAGKSTLAVRLAARTGLPLLHLDAIYWRPGWQSPSAEEWQAQIAALCRGEAWVMDGNYGGSLAPRLAACDGVVFLDTPAWRCLLRVLRRWWRYRGGPRPELPAGCDERLDMAFLWWVASYGWRRRPAILARLDEARLAGKRVWILRNAADIEDFLGAQVETGSRAPEPPAPSR